MGNGVPLPVLADPDENEAVSASSPRHRRHLSPEGIAHVQGQPATSRELDNANKLRRSQTNPTAGYTASRGGAGDRGSPSSGYVAVSGDMEMKIGTVFGAAGARPRNCSAWTNSPYSNSRIPSAAHA